MNWKTALFSLLFLAALASAQCVDPIAQATANQMRSTLTAMGYPLALIMAAYMGIKWITSEGPEETENARRGLIYIAIGILVLRSGVELVTFLLCA